MSFCIPQSCFIVWLMHPAKYFAIEFSTAGAVCLISVRFMKVSIPLTVKEIVRRSLQRQRHARHDGNSTEISDLIFRSKSWKNPDWYYLWSVGRPQQNNNKQGGHLCSISSKIHSLLVWSLSFPNSKKMLYLPFISLSCIFQWRFLFLVVGGEQLNKHSLL